VTQQREESPLPLARPPWSAYESTRVNRMSPRAGWTGTLCDQEETAKRPLNYPGVRNRKDDVVRRRGRPATATRPFPGRPAPHMDPPSPGAWWVHPPGSGPPSRAVVGWSSGRRAPETPLPGPCTACRAKAPRVTGVFQDFRSDRLRSFRPPTARRSPPRSTSRSPKPGERARGFQAHFTSRPKSVREQLKARSFRKPRRPESRSGPTIKRSP